MKNSYQNKSMAEMITTTEAIKQVWKQMWPPWKNYNLSPFCPTLVLCLKNLPFCRDFLFYALSPVFCSITSALDLHILQLTSCVLNIDFSTQPFAVERGATVKQGETLPVSLFIKVLEILWVIIRNSEDIRANMVDQWTQEIRLPNFRLETFSSS